MTRLTLFFLAILAPALSQATEPRLALVIGNSSYESGPLANPANDARLMSSSLGRLGFEVIERRNADQNTMKRAIQEFGARLEKAGAEAVGLFYYAGHGVQLNGRNYLIPTSARIEREADVEIEAVSADWVIEQMRYARNRLNVVILDACRNNPFTRSMRSADRGLATMDAPAGIMIAYSTAPGTVAQDGNGRNSPYTTALTEAMLALHQPVEQVFKQVRKDVLSATAGKQVPWESSSLTGDFYFAPPEKLAAGANAPPSDSVPGTPKPESSTSGGLSGWLSSWFTSSAPPASQAAGAAGAAGPTIAGTRALALLGSLGIQASEVDPGRNYPQAAIRHFIESTPRRVTLGSTPEQISAALALCRQYTPNCQASWYDDEALREVTLPPFEIDPAPVSVRAFRQFADTTHYRTHAEQVGFAYALKPGSSHLESVPGGSWRNAINRRPVEDDSPVVGVSFQDAVAYCQSNRSRLPSEDEWEYVARGPKRSIFPWGDDPAPVARSMGIAPHTTDGPPEGIGGRYKGLSGNVWQWVDTKIGARRVLKGGSWLESNPSNKRAATRRYELPNRADEDSGFRCARSAPVWPDADFWMSQLQ